MTTNNLFDLSDILDKIKAIALEGAKYAKDPYDIDRYKKLLDIASKNYASIFNYDQQSLDKIFADSIGSTTPKLGADAAIINQDNQILVLQRSDDQTWCLPCGWVDVGESPSQAAVREVFEEAGIRVEPEGYLSVTKKGPDLASHLVHQVNIITVMRKVPSDIDVRLSHEHVNFKWISSLSDIEPYHLGHERQIEVILGYVGDSCSKLMPCRLSL